MRFFLTSRAAVLLAGLVFLQAPERASAAAFTCRGLYTSVATVPTLQSTTSTTPVNLPGASVTLLVNGCVRVQFSAQVLAPAPGGLRIRLLLDGGPAAVPASEDFQTAGAGYDNRVATFVIRNAGSQQRTLQIQYYSIDGKRVRVTKGVMTVWYTEPPM